MCASFSRVTLRKNCDELDPNNPVPMNTLVPDSVDANVAHWYCNGENNCNTDSTALTDAQGQIRFIVVVGYGLFKTVCRLDTVTMHDAVDGLHMYMSRAFFLPAARTNIYIRAKVSCLSDVAKKITEFLSHVSKIRL